MTYRVERDGEVIGSARDLTLATAIAASAAMVSYRGKARARVTVKAKDTGSGIWKTKWSSDG